VQHRERSFGRIRARGVPELDADRSTSACWTWIPELPRRVGALADADSKRQPTTRGVRAMQGWYVQFQPKSEWYLLASPRRRTVAELASQGGVCAICRGKAYFTNTMTLGQVILMDFMKRKTRRVS